MSQSKEQALTFVFNPPRQMACDGTPIVLSEQGFGIRQKEFQQMQISVPRRTKRVVGEEQVASELTAAEIGANRAVMQLFQEQCSRYQRNENPTLQARHLLKRQNIAARWVDERIMEIFECAPLTFNSIEFRATNSCYRLIPVSVYQYRNRPLEAFLDPETRILSARSIPAGCGRYQKMIFRVSASKWIRIDTRSGITSAIDNASIFTLNAAPNSGIDLDPLVFHEWTLNRTEMPFVHIEELADFESFEQKERVHETTRAYTLGALPAGLQGIATEWIYSIIDTVIYYWIRACCIYTTIIFVRDVVIPLGLAYFLTPIRQTVSTLVGNVRPTNRRAPSRANTPSEHIALDEHDDTRSVVSARSHASRREPSMTSRTSRATRSSPRTGRVRFARSASMVSLNTAASLTSDSPFGNPQTRHRI